MEYERSRNRTEGKLFARAYPEWAEEFAIEVLEDPEGISYDKEYSWFVLGLLAHRDSPRVAEFVKDSLAEGGDHASSAVTYLLARGKLTAPVRKLLRNQAKDGAFIAFDTLSQVYDPKTETLFKEMLSWPSNLPYPKGQIPRNAKKGLERLSQLLSPNLESSLKDIILGRVEDKWDEKLYWAIDVARRRNAQDLPQWLRSRMDSAGNDEIFRRPYGHLLITYAETGGEVVGREFEILEEMGYVGNPEKVLLKMSARWDAAKERVPWPRTSRMQAPQPPRPRSASRTTLTKEEIDRILTPRLAAIPGIKERLRLGGTQVWSALFLEAQPAHNQDAYSSLTGKDFAVLAREALKTAGDNADRLVPIISAAGQSRIKEVQPYLLQYGNHVQAKVRSTLAWALITIAGPKALPVAEPFLVGSDLEVRKAAISALASERVPGAGARLAKMTDDKEIESELCWAFAILDAKEGIPFLEKLVRSREGMSMRGGAGLPAPEFALSVVGGPDQFPLLRPLLKSLKRDPNLADPALKCLGEWGDAESIPIIEKAIRDFKLWGNSPSNAGRALYRMGARSSTEALLKLQAFRTLALIGDQKAIPALREHLDPPNSSAIQALGELGDRESISALRRLLDHEEKQVRTAACTALALLDDRESMARISAFSQEAITARLIWPELLPENFIDGAVLRKMKPGMGSGPSAYRHHLLEGMSSTHGYLRYLSIRAGATARAQIPPAELRALSRSKKPGSTDDLIVSGVLVRTGHREALTDLLAKRRLLFSLNGLRNPLVLDTLENTTIHLDAYATYRELHERLAKAAGLALEGPRADSDAFTAWNQVHQRFRKLGHPPSVAEAFEMIEDSRWAVVLERDRIRILPHDEAQQFWVNWAESTKE